MCLLLWIFRLCLYERAPALCSFLSALVIYGSIDPQERLERDASDFLRSIDSEGERIDFHSLRHTCASWLIRSGADVKTVQTIMRHSDIRLTMDRYVHLFPGSEAAAISRMRDVFTQPTELRKTGTADPQQFQQQLGSETVPFRATGSDENTSASNPPIPSGHEKTQRFKGFFLQKAGFQVKRLRWELNPRWRICNPLP